MKCASCGADVQYGVACCPATANTLPDTAAVAAEAPRGSENPATVAPGSNGGQGDGVKGPQKKASRAKRGKG